MTADALAPLFGVDKADETRMLGVRLIAEGLVNLDYLAKAWGRKD